METALAETDVITFAIADDDCGVGFERFVCT